MSRPIRIIDKRNKQYFVVDDAYLNGYAKLLGPITSMVYITLCRHVDKSQNAFPSQEMIAEKIGAGVRSVKDSIAKLREWNLIEIARERTEHRWARNSYYLLDKRVWKKTSGALGAPNGSGANGDIDQGHVVHTKDTHTKDTHTLSIREYKTIDSLTEQDLQDISDKYRVPINFVKSKFDDMVLWAGGKPGSAKLKGRNWKLTLMKWVKSDALKLMENQKNAQRFKKGGFVDASEL